ncbi:substrate-binding domain-containing protein [Chelativorans sp. AA-79]|uniref:substrate-binding domain-containing protein n=1 Tax=Chelativorans sp. AA-79 TaxID=3028735 RepID=UPI0023FA3126|nr:substrate-binding domain-containing protein [Chelativorans sp. AA-79]WEX07269.1 substrate-binding domain-containing protein [Chelativorans sp. AA-79]
MTWKIKTSGLVGPSRRTFLRAGAGLGAAALASPYIIGSARAQSPVAGKTIGFSQSYATDEWLRVQRQDVMSVAKAKGLEVIATDARESPAQEIRNLEDLATRGVDAVIMITYYPDAIGPGIEALSSRGIPIIVMSSALNEGQEFAAHLAADTYGTAQKAGAYYIDALGGSGKCVHIMGRPGSLVSQARGNGWKDALAKMPEIEIVAEGIANYSRSEALTMMEDFLRSNSRIDAVYCHNDNMAKGALQAIEEAGRQEEMFITGFDGIAVETFQLIKEGRLRGTFVYPTFGGEAVEVASRVLQGQEVPKEIVFPSPMINQDNIDEFYNAETKERLVPEVDLESLGL